MSPPHCAARCALAPTDTRRFHMVVIVLGLALPWFLIAGGAWFLYQLVRQQGRILARLDDIDRNLSRLRMDLRRRQTRDNLADFLREQEQAPAQEPPSGL